MFANMFVRKGVIIGIIAVLGLTGCAANSKPGVEGVEDARTEELLSMSRSELAKQESYTIQMEQQQESMTKSEKKNGKGFSSTVSFDVDYIKNPYAVHVKSKSSEGKEREAYLSETEFHEKLIEDLFVKQGTEQLEEEKQNVQRFINPYHYIDTYLIDSENITLTEEEENYTFHIDLSSEEASEETRQLMKKNFTDNIKLTYTLDKTTLLPQKVEAEILTSYKAKSLDAEAELTLKTNISNFNGVEEIVMPEDFSGEE